ncbi:MAG: EAL domain-containing protein [Giesbergeria sp.]|uniref:EAL domain-containing protein n=1 Tax=Giesbergeria sp. TaxID=2818473 RepID=UPI00260E7CBA|nr:EAL domain-containing protein [Giesbergeria sp.]MDD2610041.1 EAL domain-containing protein [Giesbergeria sp.]
MMTLHPPLGMTSLASTNAQRQLLLQAYAILDTPEEEAFNQLAQLAAHICGTPMAAVNFIDEQRQWFKARVGLALRQTDLSAAFCKHWLDGANDVIEIADARQHPLFKDNPFVTGAPHICFYACAPLIAPEGLTIGTLLVMDTRPGALDPGQRAALHMLAQQVMAQLQLRRQHQALRLSEERFHLVANATADTVWDWNVRSGHIWWSDSYRTLFGMTAEQAMPNADAWAQRVHPTERARIVKALYGAIQGQDTAWMAEYRIVRDDGSTIWVQDRGFVIRDASGQALRMVGGIRDISADKQAHLDALHEAHTQAALVQVQQSMAALELSQADLFNLVVQATLDITGARSASLDLIEGQELVAQASAGRDAAPLGRTMPLRQCAAWQRLLHGETVQCNPASSFCRDAIPMHGDAKVRSTLVTPLRVEGQVVGLLQANAQHDHGFIARDAAHLQMLAESLGALLHLRQVAIQLRASEQQYRLLFDYHPQPIWVYALDESLRILAVNRAMLALYGYTEAELLRMSMADLWRPEKRAQFRAEVLALGPEGTGQRSLQHQHLRKEGDLIDVEVSSRNISFNGYPARQVMATDITERLRAQRELARLGRAQQLLGACNEAMVRATTEPELLEAVCRIAVEIGGYRLGWVGFARDDAAKTIEVVSHAGNYDDYLSSLHLSWSDTDPHGQGPSGITVRTGQPVIVQDVRTEPIYAELSARLLASGFHGVISLPLHHGERTFGLLYLYAPEVLHISQQEARLLQDLANDLAFGITSLRARREQQRLHASVLKVAAAVSTTTGTEFFVQLASQMAEVLDAQAGCVMRLLPRQYDKPARVASLAMVIEGQLLPALEYDLADTPSLKLLTQRQYVVPEGAAALYPNTPIVAGRLQAQAYVGQQLCDSSGETIGMIFVLFTQPLADPDFVISTLQIFAARAAAEIERQVSDTRIRQQASLLDKAQDAIIVHDLEHRITYWNKSAERVYGWPQWQVLGHSIASLLYQDPTLFYRAAETVLQQGEWTGEIVQYHRDGHAIDIEGRWTLVRGEDGQPESILAIHTDIRQRKATEREIQRLAFYDSLTGLPNRMLLLERMHQALAAAQRKQQGGALLFIDLDNFKTLNDTLGHDQGDQLLQQVAQRLNTCVRSVDTVARLGGDEFVVMLEALGPDPGALALSARSVGEKILSTLGQPYELAGYQYRSTPSIGIAPFQGDSTSVGELLKQADLAMYQAKTAGRNTLRFFDPHMQAVVTARAALEADLRNASAQGQFLLHYQPQVNHLNQCVGIEALVRWQHPERGMVSPADFVPLAEETGIILVLGRWVLESACILLARWQHQPKLSHINMAVNVSSRQFRNTGFVQEVAQVLYDTQAPPHHLKLELTESLLVEDMDTTIATMEALGQLGVGFSLDDFGTGYSSLSYLKKMPLDQLKIDQSFVRDLLTDPNDAAIVNTIIGLSRSLGLNVIAEGVETIAQRDVLLQAGCQTFQGYLFSRPLPELQLENWLHQHQQHQYEP